MMDMSKLVDKYENSSVLRGLIQLIPYAPVLESAVLTRHQNIQKNRIREFFDELGKGEQSLNEALLENDDFLHCYFSTLSAVQRTHRIEKIQFFAHLLLSSTTRQESEIDEYEESLKIIDELSYREISILLLLDTCESKYPLQEKENELGRATRFWEEFKKSLIEELSVKEDEIEAMLTRLTRSGCYEQFIGGYWDYEGGMGKTTPLFQKIKLIALAH